MKIKFTIFNNGQERYEFDLDQLEEGEQLSHFLINKDKDGIYILPMISYKETTFYPGDILEKLPPNYE